MFYDVVIIGTEAEGIELALSASQEGRRVAVIDADDDRASVELMNFAADRLSAFPCLTLETWRAEVIRLARNQSVTRNSKLERAGIERISGKARFVRDLSVEVVSDGKHQNVSGSRFVIALGTKSLQPSSFDSEKRRVLVAESLIQLDEIPRSAVIVGAGATGISTATLLAKLGSEVTVVDDRAVPLDVYSQLGGFLTPSRSLPIAFRLGDEVIGAVMKSERQITAHLASGRAIAANVIVVCVGRVGNTDGLELERVGVGVDERGRIWCDRQGQSWSPRISAVGGVVGFKPKRDRLNGERVLI